MRLIDADELLKLIKEQKVKETGAYTRGLNTGLNIAKSIINNEISLPTAYDVDRVTEQLTEVHERFCNSVACGGKSVCEDCEEYIMFRKNIEIVKAGGIDEKSE